MKLAINAISAKRGGSVTYLQNVLPELRTQLSDREESQVIVWRGPAQTGDTKWPGGIEYREDAGASGTSGAVGGIVKRLWFDQVDLPRRLRHDGADLLFSSANYGPLLSPCPQVLLIRNPVYFDPIFLARMPLRVRPYHAFQRRLTLACMDRSDVCLFPTQAMLELVRHSTGTSPDNWIVAHYGTRHDLFRVKEDIGVGKPVRLLNVSLYSDQKNFGTLLRATMILQRRRPGGFRLALTAGFHQDWLGKSAFFPNFGQEQALYRELHSIDAVADVDWKIYSTLPDLYRNSDIFVFPSYTESFGHPLVEAMASGLPIVAADVPTNRELCGDAAVYFSPFDADQCANMIERVAEDLALRSRLRQMAPTRAAGFTWREHVRKLVLAFDLAVERRSRKRPLGRAA